MEDPERRTKSDRRDQKRRNRRKMRVTGRSTRLLLHLIRQRAERVPKNKPESLPGENHVSKTRAN